MGILKKRNSIRFRFLYMITIIVGILSCAVVYYTWTSSNDQMEHLLKEKAELALQFDLAIRSYVSETIRPFAQECTEEGTFVPEVMSTSFVARSIFDKVREKYPDYTIKFSSNDPRNPQNQAESEELKVIEYFNQNPDASHWEGKITLNNQQYIALFSARRMKESCLGCHGDPKDAPASLIERYGDQAGFHRPIGEVVALDTIALPVKHYTAEALKQTLSTSLELGAGLIILLCSVYFIFNRYIGNRLTLISDHFKTVSNQKDHTVIKHLNCEGDDEISDMVTSFNKMMRTLGGTTASLQDLKQAEERLLTLNEDLKKAMDQANKLADKAEAANVAKSQFLANMSHEIRTPMNAIIGFCELLIAEDLNDEQRKYTTIIFEAGQNLLKLINDILDFSKIESGQLQVEETKCSLAKLLNNIESLMRPKATEKGIEFKIIETDGVPEYIFSDPARLNQCLLNLVNNAIKFTKEGCVNIFVSLEYIDDRPHIRFDVEDTGIGIPEEKKDAVFESFTQADGDTTRKFGGSGLGLTITKQLVELLHGQLTMSSEVGAGSVFSIIVPANVDVKKQKMLDRFKMKSDSGSHSDKNELHKIQYCGTVLVAEDTPTNQSLIRKLLEKLGVQVTIVENGKQVLQEMMKTPYDLVLMDIQMPHMDGYEATRKLRKQGVQTPIIALTANAMAGDEEKCLEAGCDNYLSKPVNRNKLIQLLNRYLPRKDSVLSENTETES